jgi:hypothetical protein
MRLSGRKLLHILVRGFLATSLPIGPMQSYGQTQNDVSDALNRPDRLSWTLFSRICVKASAELQPKVTLPGGKQASLNNALWETWADDPFTFSNRPDRNAPPKWENRNGTKSLHPITQLQIAKLRFHSMQMEKLRALFVEPGGTEEVRRNQASFNFIISHHLFFTEGLAAAFKAGVNSEGYPSGSTTDFPKDAIEVKAVWKPITEGDKPSFHWNYDASGKLYGLVGLHIMTKALPNWTWATFEWSGNTPTQPNGNNGRSDYHGSHDAFGCTPEFQAPIFNNAGQPSNQQYPSDTLTPELMSMLRDAGFGDEWLSEWSNYRLKGSQINFTDGSGQTTFLGNSVTENGFVGTSSCITCHATASVDASGSANAGLGFTSTGQSINGPLNPCLLYDLTTYDPEQEWGNYKVKNYPMDFIWAVFKAAPDGKGPFTP